MVDPLTGNEASMWDQFAAAALGATAADLKNYPLKSQAARAAAEYADAMLEQRRIRHKAAADHLSGRA